jgi:hypothetical protein
MTVIAGSGIHPSLQGARAELRKLLGVGWAYLCAASIACVSTLLVTRRIGMKERPHHA